MTDTTLGKNHTIASRPKLDYLSDKDRYLSAPRAPLYKFNIIGAGIMGQEHIRVTLMEGRATIHGLYDPHPGSCDAAQSAFAHYRPDQRLVEYESLDAACNDSAVDGLIICTPNYTHLEVLKVALKSGKHILLEKPMATTLQDAYEIHVLASDYQSVLQIGLQYRYKAMYAEAIHEALERQAIGEIKTLSILEHRPPFLDKVGQWNKFSQYSGGTLVEKCCHYFDLLNHFTQSRPTNVFAGGGMAVNFKTFEYDGNAADVIDNAMVIINYENGAVAQFNLCMFAPGFYEELILCGDKGRLKCFEQEDFLSREGIQSHLEVMRGNTAPSKISTPCYPISITQSGHSGATFYEHMHFVDNIAQKNTASATSEQGLWAVIVGVAAERSLASGEAVNINRLLEAHDIMI